MNDSLSSTLRFGRSLVSLAVALVSVSISQVRAQTNPAAQTLPLTQDFGTAGFSSFPAGFASWAGSGAALSTQAAAESSAPSANSTLGAVTTIQTTGGTYGYAVSSNARLYIQQSGNTGNGANQIVMALNCTGKQEITVGYDVEVLSAATTRTIGVVCQYRVGTTGTWTTLTAASGSNPYSQAGGTAGLKTTVSAVLPAAANDQAIVQVRWATWRGTEGGNSGGLAIDNVTVSATNLNDTTPPTISTRTPADDATGVITTTTLVAQFSEPIVKGTSGDITLKLTSDNSTVFTIPVTDAAVGVSGSTATITLPSSLLGSTGYYVNIAPGAFKDAASLDFTGITDTTTWNFTTAAVDVTAPALATLSPLDDSTTAFPTQNLVATFDESISAGTGSILIKKFSDDSVVDTITVPGAQVTVAGTVATINPAAILQYGTAYYVEIAAGTFKDASNNGNLAVTGNATWNFTTRAAPQVVISQYYEGTLAADRYIELKNLTASPLLLTGYRLVAWSDTAPSDNEGWKSGTNTSDRVTSLDGITIPANGYYLIVEPGPSVPGYAANNFDLATGASLSCTDFNGDDSIVLYNGPGFTQNEVVDALSLTANQGENISIYRKSDVIQGFDFNTATSYLNFTDTWATKTLAEVNGATIADDWYLRATQPPKVLALSLSVSSISEGAGNGAATATVSILAPLTEDLTINIASNKPLEATAQAQVTIPIGFISASFPINAINDAFLDGDETVTFTVTAPNYTPASQNITVTDELTDLPFPVVINEVDADQSGTDSNEFIELYNNSNASVSLDGVVLVLFNGGVANDTSYDTIDLTGKTIPAKGYFVIGSATVPNVGQVEFSTEGIQNGADAVALYLGAAADFPNGTPANTTNGVRVDAVVYDTDDLDDDALITSLTPGKPQIDEGATAVAVTRSISRVPDGGAAFDTTLFLAQTPTPGVANIVAPTITTPTSADITAFTATLGGTVVSDGGSAITERGIVYSATATNADPLIDGTGVTKVITTGTTGVFTLNATGLLANTGYSFKAYAINSMGTTYTSPVAVFTTLPDAITYDSWNDTIDNQAADLDFDGDGLDNGTEYFMGTVGNAFTPNPGIVGGTVTWPRATGTVVTSWSVQVSTDLDIWENATLNYSANLNTSNPAQVVFTMPTTPGKFFVRLQVTP